MNYVDVQPPKLVGVMVDRGWRDGYLRGWRREVDEWRGFVEYSVGVGQKHIGWVSQGRLRQMTPEADCLTPGV
jgi:hypothetical protein